MLQSRQTKVGSVCRTPVYLINELAPAIAGKLRQLTPSEQPRLHLVFALMLFINRKLDKVLQLGISRKDKIYESNIQDPCNQYCHHHDAV